MSSGYGNKHNKFFRKNNMTILLANGCSFTHGHSSEDESERENSTWPYFLGKKINACKVVNLSAGGGSNPRIFRTTQNWLSKQSQEDINDTVAIIQVSEVTRNEFYLPEYKNNSMENFENCWIKYKPGWIGRSDLKNTVYYESSQQGYLLWTTQLERNLLAAQILSMIGLFQTYGIQKYWFWVQAGYDSLLSNDLIEIFKKIPWINDSYKNSFNYERRCDDPERWNTFEDQHPSPVGHEQIAEQIYDYIKNKLF